MKRFLQMLALLSVAHCSRAAITITADDMFNKVGQYYKEYAYVDSSPLQLIGYALPSGLLGQRGDGNFWDFSTGPTNDIYRFDYITPLSSGHSAAFPLAKIVEQKTEMATADQSWLFFEQVPAVGRKVYGFDDPAFLDQIGSDQEAFPFSVPIVDFPDTMKSGDSWTTSTTYGSTFSTSDPGTDPDTDPASTSSIGLLFVQSSTLEVDATGTVNSPGIGFGDALRVSEKVQVNVKLDEGDGTFDDVETDYYRNYYWLRKGYGIVAQITSLQSTSDYPPENFPRAAAFVRMFETNHGAAGTVTPPAITGVTGLKATLGQGQTLLNWDSYSAATGYALEYSGNPGDTNSWKTLTTTTNRFYIDNTVGISARFYRVRVTP